MHSFIRHSLRHATAPHHARVDALFGAFDLATASGYGRALLAHSAVVASVEAALAPEDAWTGWTPRSPLLALDLRDLGLQEARSAAPMRRFFGAAAWGLQYVMEGSRLGGAVLARRVGLGLPLRYLAPTSEPQPWRAFQDELEAAGASSGAAWLQDAIGGAAAVFECFEEAALASLEPAA